MCIADRGSLRGSDASVSCAYVKEYVGDSWEWSTVNRQPECTLVLESATD